jgi:hypothetical protein
MRKIFCVLLFLSICGCTYHWQSRDPITPMTYHAAPYRSADSVGKLRRLAMMPVELKSYSGKYDSEEDHEAAVLRHEEACERFLTERKGYEIVVVRDKEGKWPSGVFESSEYENTQDLYQRWRAETAEKHTESVIKKIGSALNVDGVLVVRIKEPKPWGIIEGLLNIAFVNIPLVYNIATPDVGAWIYETTTGQLVWRTESSNIEGRRSVIDLFRDLENAVPHQLIK